MVVHSSFEDFGKMQKNLEEKGIVLKQEKLDCVAPTHTDVKEEQALAIEKRVRLKSWGVWR